MYILWVYGLSANACHIVFQHSLRLSVMVSLQIFCVTSKDKIDALSILYVCVAVCMYGYHNRDIYHFMVCEVVCVQY